MSCYSNCCWLLPLQLSAQIAGGGRHLVGGLCVGMCRNVLDALTEHCGMRHQFGRPLAHFGMVQQHLASASARLYALESMTYLVAGLVTAQPERNLRIESAAVKVRAMAHRPPFPFSCLVWQ